MFDQLFSIITPSGGGGGGSSGIITVTIGASSAYASRGFRTDPAIGSRSPTTIEGHLVVGAWEVYSPGSGTAPIPFRAFNIMLSGLDNISDITSIDVQGIGTLNSVDSGFQVINGTGWWLWPLNPAIAFQWPSTGNRTVKINFP